MNIRKQDREACEKQIKLKSNFFAHKVVDFPLEVLVGKYRRLELSTNEVISWDEETQSKFIESVFLTIPIHPIYIKKYENDDMTIINGGESFLTIEKFMSNNLELTKLEVLDTLNGFKFKDLFLAGQQRFARTLVRVIIFKEVFDLLYGIIENY